MSNTPPEVDATQLEMKDQATGMDVDYCIALAGSLFGGSEGSLEFVSLDSQSDGFRKLADGEVDVFAGGTWNLANDINEPTTGLGFSFSQPYFYGFSDDEDNLCLVTREDDPQWATFVYWVRAASTYAEVMGISQVAANEMPEVLLYGTGFRRMFRDAIVQCGNYAEAYERNLESIIPRAGRNLLNAHPHDGPQFYPMPGIL